MLPQVTPAAADPLSRAKQFISSQILGQDAVAERALACAIAGGHLLLEGPPGTGKTSLARTLAHCFGGQFRRVQMTSDLLPSDVIGVLRPALDGRSFEFRPGPVFTNFLLADELNRTNPKTQAALLEAMAEGTVSVDGHTHILPAPFMVVATQNPYEFQGVYPLPESQLDRFMMQLVLGHPEEAEERAIFRRGATVVETVPPSGTEDLLKLREQAAKVFVEESIVSYCHALVQASRQHARIRHGVSVRGALQLFQALRALAFIRGRDFVVPADVQDLAPAVLGHRLCMSDGGLRIEERQALVAELLSAIAGPR